MENGLQLIRSFGEISGIQLNIGKTKAMWLGKLANQKDKPQWFVFLKWIDNPTRILGIFFCYDSKGNNQHNFDKLQTSLDMWRSKDLTLLGKALIIKVLGVSPLIYSASNNDVPKEVIGNVQGRLSNFYGKTNKTR